MRRHVTQNICYATESFMNWVITAVLQAPSIDSCGVLMHSAGVFQIHPITYRYNAASLANCPRLFANTKSLKSVIHCIWNDCQRRIATIVGLCLARQTKKHFNRSLASPVIRPSPGWSRLKVTMSYALWENDPFRPPCTATEIWLHRCLKCSFQGHQY